MPAVRLCSRRGSAIGRRKSSLATTNFAKPGTYGYTPPPISPPLTFAPNHHPPRASGHLPGKRRSQGYIPRPPNAFMLFRADFVRQKHVPGSIETNHGSLSKIIGNCWRALPLGEKHIWEVKAKHAKAEHKLKYPDYKFRPVHNKRTVSAASPAPTAQPASRSTSGSNAKGPLSPQEDERRCEEVAALLLQGKKGEELAWAIRDLDSRRQGELTHSAPSPVPVGVPYHPNSKFPHPLNLDPMYYPQLPSSPPSSSLTSSHASSSGSGSPYALPMPLEHSSRDQTWRHRRSSSVPLPNDYAYNYPPFMYGGDDAMNLPPLSTGFPQQQQQQHSGFTLPPPSSLTSPPVSISDFGRMSFSWMGTGTGTGTGSSFSYPRPSFSFGARDSFSFAGAFGGARSSPPSSFPTYDASAASQQHVEEELPDANTSLFEVGFLNSFGASAASPTSSSPVNDAVSPFDASESTRLHAPQPVHVVSPLGVEFGEQQQQALTPQETQEYLDAEVSYSRHSTPTSSSYTETASSAPSYADEAAEQQKIQQEQAQEDQVSSAYPPLRVPLGGAAPEPGPALAPLLNGHWHACTLVRHGDVRLR
ncbi:HMG box domain-containing protein [Mycena sanguinolenta]|uniref:HMG box domain-containing protein n=1 Tax=Mycena sanguinolenta TaxID=230812 RepID=A0A8H6XRS4_9AGAR|nr:HMG box domain-containing protein [Mycena sanguinolenta]